MPGYFYELISCVGKSIDSTPLTSDARTRFQRYSVFLLIGIPTMLMYCFLNFVKGDYPLFALILLSAAALVIGWLFLRNLRDGRIVYRVNILLFSLLILYMLVTGGEGGSKILWMYTLPLIAFFLLGKNEGSFWSIAVILAGMMLFFYPLPLVIAYEYPDEFKTRFVVTYIIVTAVTYWFEYFRSQYRIEIEQKNQNLQEKISEREQIEKEREKLIEKLQMALDEVKSLKGIIPICMHCKQIRDDKGFWNRIEQYLSEHSDAQFSHSICPDCVRRHYPDL